MQETATVICRRCRERKIDIRKSLNIYSDFLKTLRIVDFDYSYDEIIKKMSMIECELSFVDVVLIYASKKLNADILSFDIKLLDVSKRFY